MYPLSLSHTHTYKHTVLEVREIVDKINNAMRLIAPFGPLRANLYYWYKDGPNSGSAACRPSPVCHLYLNGPGAKNNNYIF